MPTVETLYGPKRIPARITQLTPYHNALINLKLGGYTYSYMEEVLRKKGLDRPSMLRQHLLRWKKKGGGYWRAEEIGFAGITQLSLGPASRVVKTRVDEVVNEDRQLNPDNAVGNKRFIAGLAIAILGMTIGS